MNDSLQNLSDEELLTIIRQVENPGVSGSRYQRANTEWQIRQQQKMLEATKTEKRSASFVTIAPGAKVKGLTMKDNVMLGGGDFLKNKGELENVKLTRNKHFTKPLSQNSTSVNWSKWGAVLTGFGILVAIVLAMLFGS